MEYKFSQEGLFITEINPKTTEYKKQLEAMFDNLDAEMTKLYIKVSGIDDSPVSMTLEERLSGTLAILVDLKEVRDEQVIGFCEYRIVSESSGAKILLVSSLYVDKKFRNKGHAKRLLQYVMQLGQRSGCDVWSLRVLANNADAIKLYERFGLKITSHTMEGKI